MKFGLSNRQVLGKLSRLAQGLNFVQTFPFPIGSDTFGSDSVSFCTELGFLHKAGKKPSSGCEFTYSEKNNASGDS